MSEKRFECVFIEDDEFGGTFRRLKDNETNITYMVCDVVDLLNFQNTQIKILKDENEQLRKQVKSSETTSDATSNYNAHLESKITTLEKENEQLKKKIREFAKSIASC